jgi:hypothetical protein
MTQTLPVLFKSVEALDSNEHKNLKLTPVDNFAHAKDVHFVQTVLGEVPSLTNTYPIAFAPSGDGEVMLVAVLGLEEGKNAYVDTDNKWMAEYIPAYVQRYPFIAANVSNDADQRILCVDTQAPHFTKDGEALFDKDGEPSEFVNKCLQMVEEYDFSANQTVDFCKAIFEANILEEWQENSKYGSVTFQRINVNALQDLPKGTISAWHEKGYLTSILNIVQSQRSWREIEARYEVLGASDKA